MRLCRYGKAGYEKPGVIDSEGRLRDLSKVIDNIGPNELSPRGLKMLTRLKPETLPPVVQKQDPDADPIMSVLLSSQTASLRTLTEIADKQVKRAIESVNGVGAVTMNGDRSREIHIVVDIEVPKRLSKRAKKLLEELEQELTDGGSESRAEA